jgi:HD-like signal output (HDOD) protein
MDIARVLEQQLAQGSLSLPPLPEVAQRVVALAGDDEASSATLAKLVHRDAGLAAAVLRSANSASLGGLTQVVSLQQAVSRLGMTEVSRIAFSASMRDSIFASADYASAFARVWRRSLATGLFAKEVARVLRLNVEIAFLCGLLWRVGQPLALHGLPQVCRKGDLPPESEAIALAESLDEMFTTAAARSWELPGAVGGALGAREQRDDRPPEGHIANLAERLADAALAEKDEDSAYEFAADTDSAALNLYPDNLESLLSAAANVRSEIAAMP